jgi:hypothetical protein
MEIQKASVNTAGAYVCLNGLYPFAIGTQPYNGCIPVVRLGGHREAQETGWQCAVREVFEETGLQIDLLSPKTTYLLPDGDHPEGYLEKIQWQPETEQEHTPILVVAYCQAGKTLLSLMYLAQAHKMPTPSSEIKGLLLLEKHDIHRLCREPVTLGQYLDHGGKALLHYEFDQSLILEPLIQLRLLSRILLTDGLCVDEDE